MKNKTLADKILWTLVIAWCILIFGSLIILAAKAETLSVPEEYIGREFVEMEVLFSTDRWKMEGCPETENGFHVVQKLGTNTVAFYCGQDEIGREFFIKIDTGI